MYPSKKPSKNLVLTAHIGIIWLRCGEIYLHMINTLWLEIAQQASISPLLHSNVASMEVWWESTYWHTRPNEDLKLCSCLRDSCQMPYLAKCQFWVVDGG